MPSTVVTEPRPTLAPRPAPGLAVRVALGVAAVVAAVALAGAGRRWHTPGADGGLDALPALAWLVGATWLVVIAAIGPASAAVDPAATGRAARVGRAALGALGVVTLAAIAVAAARLGAALADGAALVAVDPTWAAWLAPVALVAVVVLAGRLLPPRLALGAAGLALMAVVAGGVAGAVAFGPADRIADGELTTGLRSAPGGRVGPYDLGGPSAVPVGLVAVDDGLLVAEADRIVAVDGPGRWFPYLRLDQLRPAGYDGHVAAEADRDRPDRLRSLFRRGDDLLAASSDGVFTLPTDQRDPARTVVALGQGRTPESSAALRSGGVPVVTEGTTILGAGTDGRGGLLVATETGVSRVGADGTVAYLPGTRSVFGPDPVEAARTVNVVVAGRSDGSGLLVVGCTWFELSAAGDLTPGAGTDVSPPGCSPQWPVAVGLDGQGRVAVVDGVSARWSAPGPAAGQVAPAVPAGRGVVAAEGGGVVAVLGDGRLVRRAERAPAAAGS